MKIRKPEYNVATYTAHRIFLSLTDHTFPVNILELTSKIYKTELSTYEEFANEIGKTVSFVANKIGKNNDAFTLSRGDEFIIVYNDNITENIVERIRFSIAHEIGHIMLNHFDDGDLLLTRGGLSEKKYKILEIEADKFAQELLLPTFLVDIENSIESISAIYDVSKQVARIALEAKKKHPWIKPTLPYKSLLSAGKSVINFKKKPNTFSIEPRDSNNYQSFVQRLWLQPTYFYCACCNNLEKTFELQIFYCVVCGSNNIESIPEKKYFIFHELKEHEVMAYSRLEIDNEGRVKQCPICENDHVTDNFCSVCGIPVINKCSGHSLEEVDYNKFDWVDTDSVPCEGILQGSDRFCPKCGCGSTFFKNELLKEWNHTEFNTFVVDPFNITEKLDIKDDLLPF